MACWSRFSSIKGSCSTAAIACALANWPASSRASSNGTASARRWPSCFPATCTAAVESGNIAVSDARVIADRPKEEQRQALAAVRQGRARTLRQAAEQEFGEQPPPALASPPPEAAFSRKRLRTEGKRFTRDLEKLLRRLDTITAACGGPNDYTRSFPS